MTENIFEVAGKQFTSLPDAIRYANFIHTISGLIVAVEKVRG